MVQCLDSIATLIELSNLNCDHCSTGRRPSPTIRLVAFTSCLRCLSNPDIVLVSFKSEIRELAEVLRCSMRTGGGQVSLLESETFGCEVLVPNVGWALIEIT